MAVQRLTTTADAAASFFRILTLIVASFISSDRTPVPLSGPAEVHPTFNVVPQQHCGLAGLSGLIERGRAK